MFIIVVVDRIYPIFFTADPKAIQQIEFLGQLKKLGDDGNATDAGSGQYMSVLTILEKIKEMRLEFFQGSVTVL